MVELIVICGPLSKEQTIEALNAANNSKYNIEIDAKVDDEYLVFLDLFGVAKKGNYLLTEGSKKELRDIPSTSFPIFLSLIKNLTLTIKI